jgi:iron complex transport system substrate-binding protein
MLNAEGIISMQPDVVIHCNDIGPETVIPQLEKSGVNLKAFSGANSFDSAKILLKELGNYFHVQHSADSITTAMDAGMARVSEERKKYPDTPSVMIIHYGQANNVFFVMSGRKGAGDRMIEMAGAKPAAYDGKGARQISAEAVAVANPDVIIATDFGYDKMGGSEKMKELPGVALTNAAKNNRIYRFEEHDLVYFGPRSPENILKLMQLIHEPSHAEKQ